MLRPTRRAVLIFLCGIPLSLLMVIYDPTLWPLSFNYGALVLMAMVGDAALAFPRRHLAVEVGVPEKLYLGERGVVTAVVGAARHRRRTQLEMLLEQRGALDPPDIVAAVLEPGTALRVALPVMPRRRGKAAIDRLWVRWKGPLSLVEMTRRIIVERTVTILPNVRGLQSAALQFYAQEALFGIKTQRQRGEGAEFDALREHMPGMDTRFIDWKHSARHRKLLCKEFRTERNHQVVLAFDTGYLMREPVDGLARLDHAINAALLLAWVSLQSGDLVGTFGFDMSVRQYLRPIRGVAGFGRIQQAMAELDYNHYETNFTLGLAELSARLKRRALVILFTDFVDTVTAELLIESMQRIASRHVVVFVTLRDSLLQRTLDGAPERFDDVAQAVVAHDLARDRRIVFERLDRLGVHCIDVASHGLSVALVNRYLLIKQRGLI